MKKIVVYNKLDLANSRKSLDLIKRLELDSQTVDSFAMSTKENVNIAKLLKSLATNAPT